MCEGSNSNSVAVTTGVNMVSAMVLCAAFAVATFVAAIGFVTHERWAMTAERVRKIESRLDMVEAYQFHEQQKKDQNERSSMQDHHL